MCDMIRQSKVDLTEFLVLFALGTAASTIAGGASAVVQWINATVSWTEAFLGGIVFGLVFATAIAFASNVLKVDLQRKWLIWNPVEWMTIGLVLVSIGLMPVFMILIRRL
jgi:hypothetical protein